MILLSSQEWPNGRRVKGGKRTVNMSGKVLIHSGPLAVEKVKLGQLDLSWPREPLVGNWSLQTLVLVIRKTGPVALIRLFLPHRHYWNGKAAQGRWQVGNKHLQMLTRVLSEDTSGTLCLSLDTPSAKQIALSSAAQITSQVQIQTHLMGPKDLSTFMQNKSNLFPRESA